MNSTSVTTTPIAVCVAGISGVGKTTLIRAHVGDATDGLDRQFTGSSVIKAIIAPATVQEFDTWPVEARTRVRHEAIRRLERLRDETPRALLVDGHFTLRNRRTGVVEPVFTAEDRRFYGALVLLDAPASHVQAWRAADSRDRGHTTLELLEEELHAERAAAVQVAAAMGVPLLQIKAVHQAARLAQLRGFLDSLRTLAGAA